MFTSINIKSFRSCNGVMLDDLESVLVLIGRNGAGKTNVMKAISWACTFASNVDGDGSRNFRYVGGNVVLAFNIDGEQYCYELSKNTSLGSDARFVVNVEERLYAMRDGVYAPLIQRDGENVFFIDVEGTVTSMQIAAEVPFLAAMHSILPEKHQFKPTGESVLKFFRSVKYYPLHNFEEAPENALVNWEAFGKWRANKRGVTNSLASLQYTLIELYEDFPDILEELRFLLGEHGLDLISEVKVDAHVMPGYPPEEQKKSTFYWVSFRMSKEERGHDFSIGDLSFGTIRILFLLVSMLHDKASVALLEQPEDGIHIALIKKLVPMLRAYSHRSQFIISSHSSAVMNLTAPSEIRFITNLNGKTTARSLDENERLIAKEFLEEEGTLTEFLQSIE